MREKIEQLIELVVRPELNRHEGDVEILSYENGILRLRMLGHCAGCPAADLTNESLIAGQLKPLVPELKDVVLVNGVSDDLIAQARALMTRAGKTEADSNGAGCQRKEDR